MTRAPALAPRARRAVARILPFGLIWLVFGLVFLVVEQAALGPTLPRAVGGVAMDARIFVFGTVAHTLVGLLVGAIEVGFLGRAFSRKSLPRKVLYKAGVYVLLFAMVTFVTFPVAAALELGTDLTDPRVWRRFAEYLTSPAHLSTDLQLGVTLAASLFYAEVSDNIGHGVLANLVTGRYHRAKEEERIFLFTDMQRSTTVAERLGHVRYFELLADYFADLSDAIADHGGQVYQYVGDEIVVSWPVASGGPTAACLHCLFAMRDDLAARATWYQNAYGWVPSFRAGLHVGRVTTGEIGILKKEIIFTGDVLNVTARVRSLCRSFDVDLLVSDELVARLGARSGFRFVGLGARELRGRSQPMSLFTVEARASTPG